MAFDAIVIGAGHNGLVCAAYLSRAGLRTLVLERRDRAGGAAVTEELLPGVRVPSLAHNLGRLWPGVVRELGLTKRGLHLVQPAVRAHAPAQDGRAITFWGDAQRTATELRRFHPIDADAYAYFDRTVRSLAVFLRGLVSTQPPDLRTPDLADALGGLRLARSFRGLARDEARSLLRYAPMPVADFLADRFISDPLRAALAVRGVLYGALGPRAAGTTLGLLLDASGADGGAAGPTVFARGGPGALADALVRVFRVAGGRLRTGCEVTRIQTDGERIRGVALASGEEIAAPIVVSGAEPKRTLLGLLAAPALGPTLGWRVGNYRTPGTVVKLNLALDGLPAFRGIDGAEDERRLRGRIVVTPGMDDLERAFDAAKYGELPEQPYVEATIPTLVDPDLVDPANARGVRHVMSVIAGRVPTELRRGPWPAQADGMAARVVAVLESVAPGLSERIVERQLLSPWELERDYGLTGGHPLHGEMALDQFFAWRPLLGLARYRMPIAGLYLCGSGAHPGGGVTGLPGRHAARAVLHDRRRTGRLCR